MVEPAQKHAVLDRCRAAVGLVLGVVHLAGFGRLVAPSGPLAVLVPQGDRVADPGRDVLAVPDVQRQARPGQPGAELPAAQERGQAAGTGQKVHGLADHGLLDRRPGRVPGTVTPPRIQFHAQPDQVFQRVHVDVAGHDGSHGRVAGDRLGGVAIQPGTAVPTAFGRGGAVPGPPGTHMRRPLLLQRRAAVQPKQVGQRDMRPHFHRLPGPLGQDTGGDQPTHALVQKLHRD
jgi:hypothetical protein